MWQTPRSPWYRDRLAPLVEPLGDRFVTATGTDTDGFGVSALVAAHLGHVAINVDVQAVPGREG